MSTKGIVWAGGKVLHGVVKTQRLLLIVTSIFLALSVSAMAILRYLFKMNLFGIEEYILICGMWLYFVGASYGSYEKSQISASVIDIFVKNKKVLSAIEVIQQVVTLVLFIIFCIYSVQFLQFSIAEGARTQVHKIPFAIGHASVTINVILMTLYSGLYLCQDVWGRLKKRKTA